LGRTVKPAKAEAEASEAPRGGRPLGRRGVAPPSIPSGRAAPGSDDGVAASEASCRGRPLGRWGVASLSPFSPGGASVPRSDDGGAASEASRRGRPLGRRGAASLSSSGAAVLSDDGGAVSEASRRGRPLARGATSSCSPCWRSIPGSAGEATSRRGRPLGRRGAASPSPVATALEVKGRQRGKAGAKRENGKPRGGESCWGLRQRARHTTLDTLPAVRGCSMRRQGRVEVGLEDGGEESASR
jgi:hypothetical protein